MFDSVEASCVRLNHGVELVLCPSGLNILGDRQLTEILLRNLVNNALQHTQQGKVTVMPKCMRLTHALCTLR